MKINCAHDELVPISKLKPHPRNRNTHPPDQIDRLAKIMEYQGWRTPIKVSTRSGFITSGHGRLAAAIKNKWTEVPVDYQDYETEEQEYADLTADNAIASWAELDLSGINIDIGDLGPFDLEFLGLKDFQVTMADKLEPKSDQDAIPDNVEAKTKPGDIYQLGRHRLMCGDSTSIDAVERLMAGAKADMVFTDPPYGINATELRNPEWDTKSQAVGNKNYTKFDDSPDSAKEIAQSLASLESPSIIWGANHLTDVLPQSPNWIVWHKRRDGQADRNSDCELAIVLNLSGKFSVRYFQHEWKGMIKESERQERRVHPTQKPIALAEWCFENYGNPQTVLDFFGGSGSTLIACEKTGRNCYMMELDPKYCDVIVARWEQYTGKKAQLLSDDVAL